MNIIRSIHALAIAQGIHRNLKLGKRGLPRTNRETRIRIRRAIVEGQSSAHLAAILCA